MTIGQSIIMKANNTPFWKKGDKAVITSEWLKGEYRADFAGNNHVHEDGNWCVSQGSFEIAINQ